MLIMSDQDGLADLQEELRYLLNRWNPIGVYDESLNFPADEYDCLIGPHSSSTYRYGSSSSASLTTSPATTLMPEVPRTGDGFGMAELRCGIRVRRQRVIPAGGAPGRCRGAFGWGAGRLAGGLSGEPAEDGDDLAEDVRAVARDRVVGGIAGEQPDVAVDPLECLDRRLAFGRGVAIEHRGDCVAVLNAAVPPRRSSSRRRPGA